MNEKGERELDVISVSQALQIAGRAGRYNTHFDKVRAVHRFATSSATTLVNLYTSMFIF